MQQAARSVFYNQLLIIRLSYCQQLSGCVSWDYYEIGIEESIALLFIKFLSELSLWQKEGLKMKDGFVFIKSGLKF